MNDFKNKRLFKFIIVMLIAILAAYLFFDRLIILYFSTAYNVNISYKSLNKSNFKEMEFSDLKILDKRTGVAMLSKNAKLKPLFIGKNSLGLEASFDLYDVSFAKEKPNRPGEPYDIMSNLVSIPFDKDMGYKIISGRIRPLINGVTIEDLAGEGDDIKLSFSGSAYNNGVINSNLIIYFSPQSLAKIPEDLSKVVLKDEPDGWRSLEVNLTGDYTRPAINVSGKLFRLRIGPKK